MATSELPLVYDMDLFTDRTWERTFRWLPGEVAIDFTGYTGKLQVRAAPGSAVLMELTTENGGIVLTSTGYITFKATTSQTDALTDYIRPKYDFVTRSPDSSEIITFLMGTINVVASITDIPAAP